MKPNRRQLLASLIRGSSAARGRETVRIAGKRDLILRNDRPEDLETPGKYLETWLDPPTTCFTCASIFRVLR